MRVPDELLETVVFIGGFDDDGQPHFGGTGFFLGVPSEAKPPGGYTYLVTARHNVEKCLDRYGAVYLRINKHDGTADFVELKGSWHYHDNAASDVAAFFVPGGPPPEFVSKNMPVPMCATPEVIAEQGVGIGDDLLVMGLFAFHRGEQRNLPILRSGIIASMPQEPLLDENSGLEYNAYLAEVRSIGGLSGSPVIAWLGPGRLHQGQMATGARLYLLGLVRGHWEKTADVEFADFSTDEQTSLNTGIAIVTPITDALDVLNGEEWAELRKRSERELLKIEA